MEEADVVRIQELSHNRPERFLSPSSIITSNHGIRHIGMVMAAGKRYSLSQFAAHPGLVALIDRAWENEDEPSFLKYVEDYLREAQGHIPQGPTPELREQLMEILRAMITEYGFDPVGLYIRQLAHAPFDHF